MQSLLLAFCFWGAAAGPLLSEESHAAAFAAHKARFGKHYTSAEETERFAAFKENRIFVQMYNAEHTGVQLALNEFADLTNAEFKALYLDGVAPSLEEQYHGLGYLGLASYSGSSVPASVDWVTAGAVTAVKNQGQCGSCWSFSAVGALEGAWQIATGTLTEVSMQQLVDCSASYGNDGCNGGLMDNAFKYMEATDLCTLATYAYTGTQDSCSTSSCTVAVPRGSVTGYQDVPVDDEEALMEAVARGPVSVAIEADQSVFQLYSSGVLTSTGCGTTLDHGVLVVGYGELDGTKYWKVKNSWGASWGQGGYVLLARGSSTHGECGVLKQPSYPVVSGTTASTTTDWPWLVSEEPTAAESIADFVHHIHDLFI